MTTTTTVDRATPLTDITELPAAFTQNDPDYLMTIEEVAEFLRVPLRTVRKWREKKAGPPARMIGRSLRFRRGDVTHWFLSQPLV